MVSQLMVQKSSAKHLAMRRFSQKGFVDLIFGHRSCPFLRIFLTLVQIRIEKITNLIYAIMGKKEEHNGVINYAPEKSEFLCPKKMTCGTEKMHISVLSNKTRNMHEDWTSLYDMMYDVWHLCM